MAVSSTSARDARLAAFKFGVLFFGSVRRRPVRFRGPIPLGLCFALRRTLRLSLTHSIFGSRTVAGRSRAIALHAAVEGPILARPVALNRRSRISETFDQPVALFALHGRRLEPLRRRRHNLKSGLTVEHADG